MGRASRRSRAAPSSSPSGRPATATAATGSSRACGPPASSSRLPRAALYLFPKLPSWLGADSREAARTLLDEARIATVPGVVFGPEGEGHLRFSFSVSDEMIAGGVEALAAFASQGAVARDLDPLSARATGGTRPAGGRAGPETSRGRRGRRRDRRRRRAPLPPREPSASDSPHGEIDGGIAGVAQPAAFADAVDAGDVAEVLDRARAQERAPVLAARLGPVGDEGEEVRVLGREAEGLGEAQVVADERRDAHALDRRP